MNDKVYEELFLEYGEPVAEELERMARKVRQSLARPASAVERTGEIVHEVQWGFANLQLQTLLRRAARLDGEQDNVK